MSAPVLYLLNLIGLFVLAMGISRLPTRFLGWSLLAVAMLADVGIILWIDCSIVSIAYLISAFTICAWAFPEAPMQQLHEAYGRAKFPIFLLAVGTVAALAHIHLPLMTFLSSPGEIGIHLGYLLSTNATHTMVAVYLSAAVYGVLTSDRMRTVLATLALFSALLFVLYAFVFPLGYPNMNGLMFEQIPIEAGALRLRANLDLLVVAAAMVGALWSLGRFGGKPILHALVLLNVSLIMASIYSAKTNELPLEQAVESGAAGPVFHFSQQAPNVLIVVLDRFMGSFVEDILEKEPELAERLDGFTWYPKTVAAGMNSIAGVHPIFGGYDYTPREMNKRNQLLRDLANESFSILPYNFNKKGWDVHFANPRGLGFTMRGDCNDLKVPGVNCLQIPPAVSKKLSRDHGITVEELAESSYTDLLVLLGTMRGVPYVLKAVLSERGPWRPFIHHSAATTFREWAELKSIPSLSATDAQKPNLNLFFNTLTHEPYYMGEDCLPMPEMLTVSDEELAARGFLSLYGLRHAVAARCALGLMADTFDWMKANGVYDNTQIVLVSDHGILGPVEDTSKRAVAGGTTANEYVRARSLLLVKELNARGTLVASDDFMPNAEVPRLVCEQLGGCVNPYLGDRPIAADGRDDPFIVDFMPWQFSAHDPRAFRIERSIQLKGKDPFDLAGWSKAPLP